MLLMVARSWAWDAVEYYERLKPQEIYSGSSTDWKFETDPSQCYP